MSFVFMVNYCFDLYNSISQLTNIESVELLKDFEGDEKKGSEENEREKEIEDIDECLFNSISFITLNSYYQKFEIIFQISKLNMYKEVDSPPPIILS